jgi:hypothetical protein
MSNIRIRTTPNGDDKYIKVNLEQEFDFIEVLSLKISQEDAYRNFCSDYGVVAGRVIINSGYGAPNARVSIFIPIDDVDKDNPELLGLYPYEVVTGKDSDGVRYNLLPRTSETDNPCFTPIGTFPTKREILDNPDMLEVYSKYYKFTVTTNTAGDFMIFGVPLGTYVVHVDLDISDMGIASQRPYDSISQGTNEKLFDSPTKFKGGKNLDKLVQIKTANMGVNVQPFWGDKDSCEIGITRLDIDMNYNIQPAAIFMGSIFGDQEKNSVNKNCQPRRAMGKLCDQVANEGTIEMIRKNFDGGIESFDVEGGRVIDENGAWAYQIPMNLDYMVTDEYGDLVLSDDTNKGVPTRTSVRFKVGMDQSGGEGRLRTRAKFLIPNNPTLAGDIDYEFGPKTKDVSFRDLHWNKIYSVSNYVSRFQASSKTNIRKSMGIKDVDDCSGDKTPFPYNKVNTNFNPIFFIICLIVKIMGFMIYILNALMIVIINLMISIVNILIGAWNGLMNALCRASRWRILRVRIFSFLRFTCKLVVDKVKYVPCIYVRCPEDEDQNMYAPGCRSSSKGFGALADAGTTPTYYDGDSFGHGGFGDLVGLDDCIAFQMAEALNIFQFDFYNDWVNGTLYSFLLKYKKRKNGREKFCEFDCDDFSGGVDGNGDGRADNKCSTNHLMDVCFDGGKDSQNSGKSIAIREGVVKKYKDELFYAGTNHNAGVKLFATDIINLGAVFKCDWQGVPKIQEAIIPTTYIIPPGVQEVAADGRTVLTTGQVDIDGNTLGLFFSINCLGLHSNYTQCLNLRHICEFGVELDEDRLEEGGTAVDGIISVNDLDADDGDRPKLFRDVFMGLNTTPNTWNLTLPYTSSFNTIAPFTDFTSPASNGIDYVNWRGYGLGSTRLNYTNFGQFKHSYYFYFGILPGKTGLDKMNQKFFTLCTPKIDLEFNILVSTTPITLLTATDGTVTFTFVGGDAPFDFIISGPNGYTFTGISGANGVIPQETVINLAYGTYTITASDNLGNPISQTFNIGQPAPLYSDAFVSSQVNDVGANDGSITIPLVGGGNGSYKYTLYNSSCAIIAGPLSFAGSVTIQNLGIDTSLNNCFGPTYSGYGYTVVVEDTAGGILYFPNLSVNGPTAVNMTTIKTDILCAGDTSGAIQINATGGQPPYIYSTTTTSGYYSLNTNLTNLSANTYNISVEDGAGTIVTTSVTLVEINPLLVIERGDDLLVERQCTLNTSNLYFSVVSPWPANTLIPIEYRVDDAVDVDGEEVWVQATVSGYVDSSSVLNFAVPIGTFADRLDLRMNDVTRACHSEGLSYGIEEVSPPPITFEINENGVNNAKQCKNTEVSFTFNISYYDVGFTERAPFTVNYSIESINSTGTDTISYTREITNNLTLITENIGFPSGTNINTTPTQCVVRITVTDRVGCVSNVLVLNIELPAAQLTGSWSNIPYTNTSDGQTWWHKRLSVSDGIGVITSTHVIYVTGDSSTEIDLPAGSVITAIITDSVGCTKAITG